MAIRISVRVKPKSKQQRLEETADGVWIVHLKSPPVDGKANAELVSVISEKFGVKKSQVRIKSGFSNPNKIVEIEV